MSVKCDFLVIGGGIAGSSAGYYFADLGKTIVLEREDVPGYHSTGRSVAIYRETHGTKTVAALSRGSYNFFKNPPSKYTDHSLISPRGVLFTGREDAQPEIDAILEIAGDHTTSVVLDYKGACELVPFLQPEFAQLNLYEPDAGEIDVAELHRVWQRGLKDKGGSLITKAEVHEVSKKGDVWHVRAGKEMYEARTLINAAGAWADELATMAGLKPVGLVPKRRTVITVDLPKEYHGHIYPMTIALDDSFYFKSEHGTALVSPMDETPMPPSDVQPDDIDIATAAWLFEQHTGIEVKNIKTRWAGLRVFTPWYDPVAAKDPDDDSFIWLVGQGGYGIKTCDAMARSAVSIYQNNELPDDLKADGLKPEEIGKRTG